MGIFICKFYCCLENYYIQQLGNAFAADHTAKGEFQVVGQNIQPKFDVGTEVSFTFKDSADYF